MVGQIIKKGPETYQVRIFLGRDDKGTKKFHTKTVHGPKRDAVAYATKIARDRDLGLNVQPTRQTVGEFLQKWLETKINVRRRTRHDYESLAKRYLYPSLGTMRLSALAPSQIQSLVNRLSDRGLSPRTVKYVFDVLKMAMASAVRMGELPRNPCAYVELPQQRGSVARSLSADEARQFIAAAEHDRLGALWILLLRTGMRPGEALALTWDDIDFDGQAIRVSRTLTRVDGFGWSFDDPKTHSSRRPIAMSPRVAMVLRRHRLQQLEHRLKAGPEYQDLNLVFAGANGAPLDYRKIVRRSFKPLVRSAGIPMIRPYDLRHTSASLDLLVGTPIKVVSERLGHSNVKMTLDTYQHVLPDMQLEAARRMDDLLASDPKVQTPTVEAR